MNALLPTVATRNTSRGPDKDLIDRATRLAFLVEAAERREQKAIAERLRALIDYHETMADLVARTESWCPEGQAKADADAERSKHVVAAQRYLAELKTEIRKHRQHISLPDSPIGSPLESNGQRSAPGAPEEEEHGASLQPSSGSPRGA